MNESFTEQHLAEHAIAKELAVGTTRELASAVAEQLVHYLDGTYDGTDWPNGDVVDDVAVIGAPFGLLEQNWVIRSEDLLDSKDVLASSAALLVGMSTGNAAAFVIAAVCMLWRLRAKGVVLDPLQRAILLTLRAKPGQTEAELCANLPKYSRVEWSASDVSGSIAELSCIRLKGGTTVALVHRDASGRLSTDAHGLWDVPRFSIG